VRQANILARLRGRFTTAARTGEAIHG
jgi:ribose transport system permease protein